MTEQEKKELQEQNGAQVAGRVWLQSYTGNLQGEEPFPYHDCGGRYTTLCVCQFKELYAKKGRFSVYNRTYYLTVLKITNNLERDLWSTTVCWQSYDILILNSRNYCCKWSREYLYNHVSITFEYVKLNSPSPHPPTLIRAQKCLGV